MAYNVTSMDDAKTLGDVFFSLNSALDGNLMLLFLGIFSLLLLVGFKRYDTKVTIIAIGTIMTFVFIPFIQLGMIDWKLIIMPISLALAGLIWRGITE